jgi:penicillin-binding protein 1A
VVVKPPRTSVQAISDETAYVMNRLLYAVTHNGVAPGVSATAGGMMPEGPMDCVGKTGTTSEDKDRWFVGLTPKYVTTVWWGYDNNYELNWSPAARGNIPPNVFKSIMTTVQANMEPAEFPEKPEGIKVAAFCTETGDLASAGCPGRVTGYYTSERVPPPCMLHGG